MKKITLLLSSGREMTFSEQELIAIVEKHLSSETTQQPTTAKVPQKPTEDEWFEVKPQDIDQKLFEEMKYNPSQERTRQLILEAFEEMEKNPKKYGRNFKTIMPKKTWKFKTVAELKKMARKLGDHNADWVEQALEWAQRIANGESWESVCNDDDTANYHRLVVWKKPENGYENCRLIGGSVYLDCMRPASDVGLTCIFCKGGELYGTVPLVVGYK